MDHESSLIVSPTSGPSIAGMGVLEGTIINELVRADDSDLKRRLRAVTADKYDGAFVPFFPFECMFVKEMFDVPYLRWTSYLTDPFFMVNNFHPWTD